MAGIKTNAQIRQRNMERMISTANIFRYGNAEKNSTEKPIITENALITMPRPVVVSATLVASEIDFPSSISDFNLQKIWIV